jgi:GNAT superfamily N-acetyltransferase
VLADIPLLQQIIRASVLGLQGDDYTLAQRERALEVVFGVDTQLVLDGTYLVAEIQVEGEWVIAGCGGWSKRKTLFGSDQCAGREDSLLDPACDPAKIRAFFIHPAFARRGIGSQLLTACETAAAEAGYRSFEMGATLTGVPLYSARGYLEGERREVPLGGGLSLPIIHMVKRVTPPTAP